MKAVEVSAENLIVEVGNEQKIEPSSLSEDTERAAIGLSGPHLRQTEHLVVARAKHCAICLCIRTVVLTLS